VLAEWVGPLTGQLQFARPFSTVHEPCTNGFASRDRPQSPKPQSITPNESGQNQTIHASSEEGPTGIFSEPRVTGGREENKGGVFPGKTENGREASSETPANLGLEATEPFMHGPETVGNGFEEGAL